MATSRTHLTALPPGFITVRIMQLLFTVVIIALSIFILVVNGGVEQFIVVITAGFTLIVLIWLILASYVTPKAYNYWAVLAMEITFFLAWIDAFIFALGSSFNSGYYYSPCSYSYNYSTQSYENDCSDYYNNSSYLAAGNAAIAVAAFAACLMLLWLVSMIVVSVFIARHRDAGGHCKLGSEAPVFRNNRAQDPLMAQSDFELRQQNLALQQQYLSLQQQHLDLQRSTGIVPPPNAMMGYGQQNIARGGDLERGDMQMQNNNMNNIGMASEMGSLGRGYEQQGYAQAYAPPPQMQQVSPIASSAEGSGYQHQQVPEMAQMGKGKDRADNEQHVMSGAHQGDEITAAPIVR